MDKISGAGNPFHTPETRAQEKELVRQAEASEKVARIGFNWLTLGVFATGTLTGIGMTLGGASLVLLLVTANPVFFPLGIGALVCLAISTVLIIIGCLRECLRDCLGI